MNTIIESPLGTNKRNFSNMVDVRIILSALWIARKLSGLQGDSARLHDPVALQELVSGTSDIPVTNALVLILSTIMAVPILMSFLSLILKEKANRRANISAGIFFVAWEVIFLIFIYSQDAAYEIFWGFTYLVCVSLVVWYAWKWPKQEA
jgi:hypothetical protein